jgi:hypothetical protein
MGSENSVQSHYSSVVELTEQYHLFPFIFLFMFVGVVSTLAMAAQTCFRFLGEVVECYYDFRLRCAESKRHYQRVAGGN